MVVRSGSTKPNHGKIVPLVVKAADLAAVVTAVVSVAIVVIATAAILNGVPAATAPGVKRNPGRRSGPFPVFRLVRRGTDRAPGEAFFIRFSGVAVYGHDPVGN